MRTPKLTHSKAYRVAESSVRVETSATQVLTDIAAVYGRCADGSGRPCQSTLTIRPNGSGLQLHRSNDPSPTTAVIQKRGDGMPVLEREFNRCWVESLDNRLLLHAAAVGCGQHAVILPAAAGSGKTTLAAGLVRRGFGYLTDELVILHSRSRKVVPFPKALSLKEGSFSAFASFGPDPTGPEYDRVWYLDPEHIRPGSVVTMPLPIAWIILPRYQAGSDTRCEPLTVGQTVLGLFENTVNIARHKEAGLDRLIRIAGNAPGYRLVFGNLDQACDAVLEVTGRRGQ